MRDVDGTGMALGVAALLTGLSLWGQQGRGSFGNTKNEPYPFAASRDWEWDWSLGGPVKVRYRRPTTRQSDGGGDE